MAKPEIMSKDPSELTEEEIIQVRDFQKKEEAFLEERERLKKSLEAEFHKLQAGIVQGMEQFDERVLKLFQLKIRTEMAIHQEELKVLRLSRSLLVEDEVSIKAKQLNQLLDEKKVEKVQSVYILHNSTTLNCVCSLRFGLVVLSPLPRRRWRTIERSMSSYRQRTEKWTRHSRKTLPTVSPTLTSCTSYSERGPGDRN